MRDLRAVLLATAACTRPELASAPAGGPAPTPMVEPADPPGPSGEPSAPPPVATDPVLLVTDSAVLRELEGQGLSFPALVAGVRGESLGELDGASRWRSIVEVIEADLRALASRDAKAGVGMRFTHRLFDGRWLVSSKARMELVGVANRLDRRAFHAGTCGETRLVFRLAYATQKDGLAIDSRLPMTVNVVYFQPDDGNHCREVARRWLAPSGATARELSQFLVADAGPLARSRIADARLKSVEVDMQTVRWPSTVRPDLGGHAGYVLRVFHRDGERFVPAPLENTPDVARLRRDPRARASLIAWVREHLEEIDAGIAVAPAELLASKAESFTPRGLARSANRPWSQVLDAHELSELDLAGREHIASPRALLRRLDGSSCQGCHQIRSVAGFHLLGDERDPDDRIDALALAASPHALGDLPRREHDLRQLAEGFEGVLARPLPDAERHAGVWGSHCGRGDGGFARYGCGDGLRCVAVDDPDMGTCVTSASRAPGDLCEVGELRPHADPVRDRVVGAKPAACDEGLWCEDNRVGFPAGMCAGPCSADTDGCGAIPNLVRFNNCLGARHPFEKCVADTASPRAMRACDEDRPCRDDYVCARAPERGGVCMPPYFLFQLRVDGHPL